MGHKPLICGDFTTRQPTDVDDLRFTVSSTSLPPPTPQSNLQFFLKRCELLLLVQSMKSRYVRDMETGEFSIDEASTFENHVHQILDTLPPRLKVDVDLNHSNTAPLPSTMLPAPSEPAPMASLQSSPPDAVRQPSSAKSDRSTPGTTDRDGYVLAQACELSSIANRIKLKLNLPFLKPKLSEAGVPVPVPRQAILGALNAVHNITHASRLLHSTFRSTRPATLMYYSYSWTLFTAAIVSAHTIIHGQQDHFTSRAMEDVQAALFILRDSSVPTGKDENGRNATSEAVRIPEAMKAKADAKLNPQKRKQREGEEGAAGSSIGPAAKIQAVEAGEGSGSGIGIGAGAMEEMQHLPSQTPELEMAYRMPSESLATPIDGVLPPHFHQQPQQYQQPTQWTGLMGLPAMPLSVDASGMPKMTKDDAAAAAAAKDGKNAHGKPRVGFRNRNAPSKKEGSAPSSPTASTSQSPAASASASVSGSGSGSGSGSAATVGKATSSRKRNLVVRDRTTPRQNLAQAVPQRATSRQHQQHQQQQQHSERQHSQTHHPAQHVPSQASHHGGQPLHINTSHIPPIYHDVDGPSTPTPTLMYGQSPITFGPSSGHPLSGHSLDVQHSAGGQDGYQRASSTFEHSQPQLHPHPDFVNESNAYGVRYGSQQPQPQQQPQQQSYNGYNHTLTPSATTPQQHFPSMVPQHSMSHSHPSSFAHNPAPQVSEQPSAANFASAASQQGQMVMQNYSVYWDQQHQQPQYASGAMGSQALLPGNATLQQHSESNAASSYLHPGSDFSRSLDVPLESRQEAMDVNMGDQSRFGEPYGWVNPYPGAG
ncbi:hypothetical protein BD410DRAFT_322726 [Rickenella mellea]|uniref:Transcription factor domain-containing protein n=1 Tax=Rickenella mellea TaxID=50990 RepID=A0A4Y7Q1D4_9AGAM|nr:hypothetical protein BD410DRAFT_322726 [Rickenella mellea]